MPGAVRRFRKKIYDYFHKHAREFAWRKTRDPYHVLVSEVMLQQTQTGRVEEKFREFVAAFPSLTALARARLGDVLRVWQGMGYNRRALYLHQAAQEAVRHCGGTLPRSVEELEKLPGIGPATARSIAAYAFNEPVVFIETNIRTVYIHSFFPGRKNVADVELSPLVEQTLDRKDPWKWYNALMDYGVMLKAKYGNLSRRSAHYARQSSFRDSDRRVRGEILRRVSRNGSMTERKLRAESDFPVERVRRCFASLCRDGLLVKERDRYRLP
jgi:A/G-specific adenine glycosylase